MKLTGRAKQDFALWLRENLLLRRFINEKCGLITDNFGIFPESMQWGVYQDFFEDQGICIGKDDLEDWFVYSVLGEEMGLRSREEAIKEACDIYNG